MSKPLSAVDSIGPAFERMKHQLFTPFRFRRWLRLAVVCLTTGEFAGGGGGGYSGGFNPSHSGSQRNAASGFDPHAIWNKVLPWLPWILAGIAILAVLSLLWMYVASVYRFVLLDSVLYDRCQLKGSWTRWERLGRSYFGWRLLISVLSSIASALLIGLPLFLAWRAGLFRHPFTHLGELILGGGVLIAATFVLFLAIAIVALFAKDFCVPIMAVENVGIFRAWRMLLPLLGAEKLQFAGYVLMKILLAMGNAMIVGIAALFALLVMVIPAGIVALVAFLIGKGMGLSFTPGVLIVLVLAAGVALTVMLYVLGLINTPSMVFFQSYVLQFLGGRFPPLGAVMYPQPMENSAGPEPPPSLPPAGPSGLEPSMG